MTIICINCKQEKTIENLYCCPSSAIREIEAYFKACASYLDMMVQELTEKDL